MMQLMEKMHKSYEPLSGLSYHSISYEFYVEKSTVYFETETHIKQGYR